MKFRFHFIPNIKALLVFIILAVSFSSCSLVKIESEQKPLSKQDLNIRVLTQSVVNEASNRIEFAADSIITSTSHVELQKHAYRGSTQKVVE